MRRIAAVMVAAIFVALVPASPSQADDIQINAQVLPGARTITLATATPFANVARLAATTSTLAVSVGEVGAAGDADWSVTVRLCGTTGTFDAPDCTNEGDRMHLSNDLDTEIAGSALTISGRSVETTGLAPGGTVSTPGDASQNLSAMRTIFQNTGQDTGAAYTAVYASTSTITLNAPNTPAGTYRGYLVVTLAT